MLGRGRSQNLDNMAFDNAFQPETTRWESMRASYGIAAMSTLRGLFWNTGRPDRNSDQMLSANELNDFYPQLEKPFEGPVSREYAEYIIERDMERKRLQAIMQSGPGGASQWVLNTGAAFGASMVDPFEVGASMLGGGLLRMGVQAYRAGRVASLLSGTGANLTRTQQVQRAAAYNLAGSAAVEPMLFVGAKQMHEERTIGDAIVSTLASTIMGTALEMSFRVGGDVMRDFSNGQFGVKMKTKLGLATQGRDINLDAPRSPIDAQQIVLRQGADRPSIEVSNLERGSVLRDARGLTASGSFYGLTTSLQSPNARSRELGFSSGETFLSNASHFHSDPSLSLRGVNMDQKKTFLQGLERADISQARLVDADVPMGQQNPIVRAIMKEMGAKKNQTFRQALDDVPMRDQNRIEQMIEEQFRKGNLDGFVTRTDGPNGVSESVTVFNQDRISSQETYGIPTQDSFLQLSQRQIRESLENPENQAFYDKQGQDTLNELPPIPRPDNQRPLNDVGVDEATIQEFSTREDLAPEVRESLREYESIKELQEKSDVLMKSAIHCGGN